MEDLIATVKNAPQAAGDILAPPQWPCSGDDQDLTVRPETSREERETQAREKKVRHLNEVMVCALNNLYPPKPPAMIRMRTLNFVMGRLAEKLAYYGITSDVQKSHFLGQLLHETGGFTSTIERNGRKSHWKKLGRNRDRGQPNWDCQKYAEAIKSDTNYYNHEYSTSKRLYRAAFRGRGLIQLTGCHNQFRIPLFQGRPASGKARTRR